MNTKFFLRVTKLLCVFMFLTNLYSHAQVYSKRQLISQIKSDKVFWIAGTDTISLEKGKKEGNKIPDSLTIVVNLDSVSLKIFNKPAYLFEFKWYRWGPTEKYLKSVTTDTLKYAELKKNKSKEFTVSSTKTVLTSGWWEVNIVSKADNGYLNIDKKFEFQIYFDK